MVVAGNKIIGDVIEVAEENFKSYSPEKFHLSIDFGTSWLSYAVFDPVSRFIKKTGTVNFRFSEKKDSYAILFSELQGATDVIRQGFHTVYLTWNRPGATLVPAAFYSEARREELLGFNFGNTAGNFIVAEDVQGLDVKVIYALPQPVKLFFDTHISNYRLKHISTTLIECSFSMFKNERKAFININPSDFNLLIMDKGLKFFNSFSFQSAEDILYYTLFALEQSGFNVHEDKVLLGGEIEAESGIHQLLKQYIKNISFASTDKSLVRGGKLAELPHHFYYSTLNRFVCG